MAHSDSGFVVREVPIEGPPHLELRRLDPAGAIWALVRADGVPVVRLEVWEACALAGTGWWDVLQATKGELELWDPSGAWRGSLRREHPSDDPAVVALWRSWLEAWELQRDEREERPRACVEALELPLVLAWTHESGTLSVRITVTGHGTISDHASTVRAVLEEAVERRSVDTVAIVGSARGKIEAMPYPEACYAHEWSGSNLAREWPRDADLGEVAAVLERTLAVYGLDEADDLDVDVFPAAT